jgi:uncharacterized protein (DUF849 family)
MEDQIQKAVDCYNAGATVLHLHVRELDGKGSKRLSKFNELIAGVRKAAPDMVISGRRLDLLRARDRRLAGQVAVRRHAPHAGRARSQAGSGHRHRQHHADERRGADGNRRPRRHVAGRAGELPSLPRDDRPSSPSWVEEHVRRPSAAGIQSAFQFPNINSYETVERLIRRGVYKGPLVMNWVAIGGGMDQPTIYSLAHSCAPSPTARC